MKTYSKADLQIVRLNNNDIVTLSTRGDNLKSGGQIYVGDRFREFEDDFEQY